MIPAYQVFAAAFRRLIDGGRPGEVAYHRLFGEPGCPRFIDGIDAENHEEPIRRGAAWKSLEESSA